MMDDKRKFKIEDQLPPDYVVFEDVKARIVIDPLASSSQLVTGRVAIDDEDHVPGFG